MSRTTTEHDVTIGPSPRHTPELHEALAGLREALGRDALGSEFGSEEIASACRPLRDAFDRHVASTEGEGGMFRDVIRRACWLESGVTRLVYEHLGLRVRLDLMLRTIEDPAGSGCADAAGMRRIREDAPALVEDFDAHRQREALLLFEAYLSGIGGD